MTKILVVDDEQMIRFAFEQFLKDEGYVPLLAPDTETALGLIKTHEPQIVFLDYRLPGKSGLDLLAEIQALDSNIAVIFMTAFGEMDVAIKAMQLGAHEYFVKPLDLDRIRVVLKRILEGKKSLETMAAGREKPRQQSKPDQMVGRGPAMQEVFKLIGLLTTQEVTVLVTGESGVGKELVARAIHQNSPRRKQPFVAINCGAMPENLLEAELFGYEKGAFTGADTQKIGKFELAATGTLFLDEIGELRPLLQVKLLRVLQEKVFQRVGGNSSIQNAARVLAATNRDLKDDVATGRFRSDLFYRLHLVQVHLPPLRERREDIRLLVEHFICKANLELNRSVHGITPEALERLEAYAWPGNVRELENEIKRAMVLSRENILPAYLFELRAASNPATDASIEERLATVCGQFAVEAMASPHPAGALFDRAVGIVEKTLISETLQKTRGNQARAAQILGLHRSTLRKKISRYGL